MKKFLSVLTIFFVLFGNITVYADSSQSEMKYITVYQHPYEYNSNIFVNNDSATAYGYAKTETGTGGVPAGYIGINSRLYNSSGTLIKSSDWTYNSTAASGIEIPSGSTTSKGTYYSQAQVAFYNGNGYNTYTANKSPNLQLKSTYVPMVNENGEIYGSRYFLNEIGVEPNLVEAEGQNGFLGYVRLDDLDYKASSLEEAIAYQNELLFQRTIPVYENDGITVIDSFLITTSSTIIE